jgi:hypothetical protein
MSLRWATATAKDQSELIRTASMHPRTQLSNFSERPRTSLKCEDDPASLSKSEFINPQRTCFAKAARETPILCPKILALTIVAGRGNSISDQRSQCQPCNRSKPKTMAPFGFPRIRNLRNPSNFRRFPGIAGFSYLCTAKCSTCSSSFERRNRLKLWNIGQPMEE